MVKRAQGLGIPVMIVIVLALVTMALLLFLTAKHGGIFTKTTTDCESQQGVCVANTQACFDQNGQPLSLDCPKAKPACCKLP